jgi:hypothetical protein
VKKLPKINFKKKYFQGKTSSRKKNRGKLPNISIQLAIARRKKEETKLDEK